MNTRRIPPAADYPGIELTNPSGLRIRLTTEGRPFSFRCGDILINQVLPTPAEIAMTRLFLREPGASAHAVPLVGPAIVGPGTVGSDTTGARPMGVPALQAADERSARWRVASGSFEVDLLLEIAPEAPAWIWRATVRNVGAERRAADLLYGQDLGLGHEAGVRMNEAYCSQYIDHRAEPGGAFGPVILSRQNQAQDGRHPWIAQGCLDGAAAWSTDGYQFFGLDHRLTGYPAALDQKRLPCENLQYEFAYAALQSNRLDLSPGAEATVTFFAVYRSDHPEASGQADLAFVRDTLVAWTAPGSAPATAGSQSSAPGGAAATAGPRSSTAGSSIDGSALSSGPASSLFEAAWLHGDALEEDDWEALFPAEHGHIERDGDGERLSFFLGDGRHVVSRRKEEKVERPHAHILRSGDSLWLDDDILGTTVGMTGIFSAQVYLGNTNLARFLSVVRNPLNVMRGSGQRICVSVEDGWRQLGIPSAFEMGFRHARWLYQIGEDLLEVTTRAAADAPRIDLTLAVLQGEPRAFLISHQIAMGEGEMAQPFSMTLDDERGRITCRPDSGSLLGEKWPEITFTIESDPAGVARLGGDELLFSDGESRGGPHAVVVTRPTCSFALRLRGANPAAAPDSDASGPAHASQGGTLPRLSHSDDSASRVSDALPWFAHDAWVHFTAPHGIEQYGGAAWGTRDVSQGPVEWLLATRRYDVVRRILLRLFEQQYETTGGWPQWFMFEPFRFIQSVHSHGDIVFWPLKALCDYIEASGDLAILDEEVPYTDPGTFALTPHRAPIAAHVEKILAHYDARCLPGTDLVDYGDGDWDDTLQPADPRLRSRMVSAWTVGLAFDAFRRYRAVCARAGLKETASRLDRTLGRMHDDFHHLLMPDGVTAGFMVFEDDGPRPLLHTRDEVTGIRYRLLPMTRAVLAELFTPEEARTHFEIIRQHLLFPDGVRLMSEPVPYRGGVERWFRRAEMAANFGREIGLMYTHAHLRYAEALAKLGDGEGLWRALQAVNPIGLREAVPNALPRQANVYFTSSDGAFPDRYEAGRRFEELRDGRVPVKGGWRLYSSGSGLFLHKVITRLLGLRDSFGDVVIDPVLPRSLDGLVAEWEWNGRPLEIRYQVRDRGFAPSRIVLNGRELPTDRRDPNPYRDGGVRISKEAFAERLEGSQNRMDIIL